MASRLYRSTQPLYRQVAPILLALGVGSLGSLTLLGLMAVYVTGLILLDARPTQTRVADVLPARCHDALNRLLRLMPWSTRGLMAGLSAFARRLGPGYLMIDEVVIPKPFGRQCRWVGRVYSTTQRRQVDGLQVVVVVWGSLDARWRIPVAFRLWRPKKHCARHAYHTKPELAQAMLRTLLASGVSVAYVTFDTHYTSRAITKMLTRLKVSWVGSVQDKTIVVWRGRRQSLAELTTRLRLKWRPTVAVRAAIVTVYTPNYGQLRLVVAKNSRGKLFYVASHDLTADLPTLVRRKRSRWSVETVFRDTKQLVGLQACQCWVDQAMVRHIALVLLTFVVLQRLRCRSDEGVGQVKLRWQLAVIRQGQAPPPPLSAAPPHLRPTA